MSAFGFVMVALGILTAWAGFKRVMVIDILKSFLNGSKTAKTASTKTTGTTVA